VPYAACNVCEAAATWVNPVCSSATSLGLLARTDQFYKADGLRSIPRWTSRPFGKESTAVDGTRLAIEQIEKIFLQGLAASPRFGRKGATRGFRDVANLQSNHECILPSTFAAFR
jgi:hypothetical protein